MEILWATTGPLTVADVLARLNEDRDLAYTTVMTVLDRLAKKGLAARERVDRAWHYRAADPQAVVAAREIVEDLRGLPDDVRAEALRLVEAELR